MNNAQNFNNAQHSNRYRSKGQKILPTTSTLLYLKNCSNDMNNPSKFVFNHSKVAVITNLDSCSFLFQSLKAAKTNY